MIPLVVTKALFYLFSLLTILFAVIAVTSPRILRAAVALMMALLGTAALYALSGAHFLAGIQVLVYVGGIVVLLVFAVMLTQNNELIEKRPSILRVTSGVIAAGSFLSISLFVLHSHAFQIRDNSFVAFSDVSAIGRSFLNYGEGGYALPFEIISILLLAAIIGGIVIAKKTEGEQGSL